MSSDRLIYDITPFTHLDYPGKLAAVAWFAGCNMRCMYCYNSDIVFSKEGSYTVDDLLALLKRRIGLLDAVVLSGGEPTLHELEPICRAIKTMGFSIKLDTNGLRPDRIADLVAKKLVDYIALDFKAGSEKFGYITGSSRYERFRETLDFLIGRDFDFEVRTTVHADLLSPDDINNMMKVLKNRGYNRTYYLQNFIETPNNIANITKPSAEFDRQSLGDLLPTKWRN
ncbi:anaerobic ribonucleoside-triphosphate reductase activating protein [Hydrogenimonas urashimensis]|uniref:anaerobic ribonucleoside-triphosphate reductase activating protein n=1 Tax=Hydrogenimonas urashimensis TaxID=2740515 RepID=UPI001F1B5976|nr:anaerobic ribonucleoside-triphosphate reductase activating protein [Hydrogenimonas urashimensis]